MYWGKSHNNLEYENLRGLCIDVPDIPKECFEGAVLCSDRVSAIKLLPANGLYCEVGVAYGEFTDKVIEMLHPKEVHLVDRFDIPMDFDYWGKTYLRDTGLPHLLYIRKKYPDHDRVKLHVGDSSVALSKLTDNYFDIIYVDAGHTYKEVTKDIEQSFRVIKNGGYIIFNDYTYISPTEQMGYGVYKAVNEFLDNNPKCRIVYYALGKDKMDDIAIKVVK